MIKMLWIFVLSTPFLLCLPGAAPDAEDPASLTAIETAFSSCIASLDATPRYAPLAIHGFLAPPSRYSRAQLSDPAFATAAEARLVADFEQAEVPCEVDFRINLENVDATLSDLASQSRQLTDVNELLLIDDKENWGEFSTYRAQIDMSLQQASAAALAAMSGANAHNTGQIAGLDQIASGPVQP